MNRFELRDEGALSYGELAVKRAAPVRSYTVSWSMTVEAESPEVAAWRALERLGDALVFDVREAGAAEGVEVDLGG